MSRRYCVSAWLAIMVLSSRALAVGESPGLVCKYARVVSGGVGGWDSSEFTLDGAAVVTSLPVSALGPASTGLGRGINIVDIDPVTQEVVSARSYDVLAHTDIGKASANAALANDLQAMAEGEVVLLAVRGGGLDKLDDRAYNALGMIGANVAGGKSGEGYALIGRKGYEPVKQQRGFWVQISSMIPCAAAYTAAPTSAPSAAPSPAPTAAPTASSLPVALERVVLRILADHGVGPAEAALGAGALVLALAGCLLVRRARSRRNYTYVSSREARCATGVDGDGGLPTVAVVLVGAEAELERLAAPRWAASEGAKEEDFPALAVARDCTRVLLASQLSRAGSLRVLLSCGAAGTVGLVGGRTLEISPAMRVPRGFGKFVHLLAKQLRGPEALLSLGGAIAGAQRYRLSARGRPVEIRDLASGAGASGQPQSAAYDADAEGFGAAAAMAFSVGLAEKDADFEEAGEAVAICQWPLSSEAICRMVCHELEAAWGLTGGGGGAAGALAT